MPQKEMVFVAPFPPHGGGISYYSATALQHLQDHLSIYPLGFSSVFPGRKFKSRNEAPPFEIPRPLTGYFPWTWSLSSLPDSIHPGVLLLPSWTVWLVPCFRAVMASFSYRWPSARKLIWCHNVVGHKERWTSGVHRYLYREGDLFITHSSEETRKLEDLDIPRDAILSSFLPIHPVPELRSREDARKELSLNQDRHLLFYGTLRPYKGLDCLSRAWALLPAEVRERTRLTIAGERWSGVENSLESLEKLGAVILDHYQSASSTGVLFSSADAIVLPYEEATGSGILMMAYYAGIPAIVSRLPSLMDYVEDGISAYTFHPGDPEDLARVLMAVLDKPRTSILDAGMVRMREKFSWTTWTQLLLNFLESKGMI
ncbi:MAG TPA: glycosyltransferase [Thermoanaerobaculia bacterium]|nr:glycosyltransferase [Thermoanaerobaculia bacterium]HUM30951.1 glycosyltransferase [Thermoanaerobaculia bacterium]HXK69389.1 glycosyltransferase [Thermoanaerobaculia bacterium]